MKESAGRHRIASIKLDEGTVTRRSPEVEHERAIAMYDLMEQNYFEPVGCGEGPYNISLGIEDNRLVFDIRDQDEHALGRVPLPMLPFRKIIREYFMICESYYDAIKMAPPSRIEAIDMGRRGVHNEGALLLQERLTGKIDIDQDTARRLFTLVCVLHIRG